MKKLLKPVFILFVIALALVLSLSAFWLPAPQPQTAGPEQFSAERAFRHVQRIASETHPVGSPEQKKVRDYLVNEITSMGYSPEIQRGHGENDAEGFLGFVPYSGELENITFRLEGSGNTEQDILMLAHYDSTLGGPGAADDASGVAVLLETARALKQGPQLVNDIIFLFADGEEAILLGSKLFAENTDLMKTVDMVVNFESRGNRGPSILFETSDKNRWLMDEFIKTVQDPVAYSFTSDIYKMVTNVTDFTSFLNAGKGGLNFANVEGMEKYHNPQDTPENLDQGFLQHQGAYAMSMARHFGNIALDRVKSGGNAVYFTLAKSLMVIYPEQWTVPLTLFALVLLAAVLFIGFRKKLVTAGGVALGALLPVVSIVAAALFGVAAQSLFSGIYFKLDSVRSLSDLIDLRRTLIFTGNTWFMVSLILAASLVYVLQRLFARKTERYALFLGSVVMLALLAVVSAFLLPGAGYIFLWPLIITLAGLLLDHLIGLESSHKHIVLFALCTLAFVLVYLPVGYLLYQALTMMGAAIPITLLAIPASFMILAGSLYAGKTKAAGIRRLEETGSTSQTIP